MRLSGNFSLLLILFLSVGISAQRLSKEQIANLITAVAEDEKATIQCERQARENQIKKFGKPLPKISGHCWFGCPVSVPKPLYPEIARRNRIKGEVVVNAIVDETGKVVYAKAVKGPNVLKLSAVDAAYDSTYSRKLVCDRPIKFWWRIRYYFQP